MTRIVIFEGNPAGMIAREGHGNGDLYMAALRRAATRQPEIEIRHPYAPGFRAEAQALDGVDGIVFTGSSVQWSVDAPEAAPLRAAMEAAFAAGKPVLGSCNGLQLAAVVLGGAAGPSPNGRELGIARDVTLSEAGRNHPLHRGRRPVFAVPCVHRDEVTALPRGAVVTAGNAHSPVQAMVYEEGGIRFWGMQYHPECRPAHFAPLIEDGASLFNSAPELAADLRAADADPEGAAARRLGAIEDDLAPHMRLSELRNWLDSLPL